MKNTNFCSKDTTSFLKSFKDKVKFYLISDKIYSIYQYVKAFKELPKLEHPQTLTEFILHRKIYAKNPLYTLCTDKYKVRDYVQSKIGKEYLIPLLAATDNIETIDLKALPHQFVIKPNHSSQHVCIVTDKSQLQWPKIKIQMKKWLNESFYELSREWQYKNIKPMILIEKFLTQDEERAKDYKFFCINGKVAFIYVITSLPSLEHSYFFCDTKFQQLPFYLLPKSIPFISSTEENRPKNFDDMIRIAEILSSEFDFVRVDLYNINGKIYFGELTFTPNNGLGHFVPVHYNKYFGEMLETTHKNL